MNISIVIYTHTDYKDVWPLIFGQTKKYLPLYKKIIFVNKYDESIPQEYTQIFYNNIISYTDRVSFCLEKISDDFLLFCHEDMPLYKEPNHEVIKQFFSLIKTEKADFIKLIKVGVEPNYITSKTHPNLIKCPTDNLFSIQPTLTSLQKLKTIFNFFPGLNIWEFESNVSLACSLTQLEKCFMATTNDEKKRGLYHWDSGIYPYIATAINKGKWNISEYKNELSKLFHEYKINPHDRGIC